MIEEENLTPQEPPEEEPTGTPDMMDTSRPEETPIVPEPIEPLPTPPVDGDKDLAETATEIKEDTLEESQTQKEPSKFQVFMRKLLIWAGIVIAAALAGFLAFYFAFYLPQAAEFKALDADLTAATEQIATLEAENTDLSGQLESLSAAEFHALLLDIETDIYAARLALDEEDTVAAKAALAQTDAKAAAIQDDLAAFDTKLATELPQRISLIRSGLEGDIQSAIADCNILLDKLSGAEAALMP